MPFVEPSLSGCMFRLLCSISRHSAQLLNPFCSPQRLRSRLETPLVLEFQFLCATSVHSGAMRGLWNMPQPRGLFDTRTRHMVRLVSAFQRRCLTLRIKACTREPKRVQLSKGSSHLTEFARLRFAQDNCPSHNRNPPSSPI